MHVVFIAIPGWVLAAVLYIMFAAMAGARGGSSKAPSTSELESTPHLIAPPPTHDSFMKSPQSAFQITLAVIGAVALVICIALALWVGLSGEEGYQKNLATFKTYLAVASVIHLTAGTIWVLRFDQGEEN